MCCVDTIQISVWEKLQITKCHVHSIFKAANIVVISKRPTGETSDYIRIGSPLTKIVLLIKIRKTFCTKMRFSQPSTYISRNGRCFPIIFFPSILQHLVLVWTLIYPFVLSCKSSRLEKLVLRFVLLLDWFQEKFGFAFAKFSMILCEFFLASHF